MLGFFRPPGCISGALMSKEAEEILEIALGSLGAGILAALIMIAHAILTG